MSNNTDPSQESGTSDPPRRKIKIGSQRPGHETKPKSDEEMPAIPADKPSAHRLPAESQPEEVDVPSAANVEKSSASAHPQATEPKKVSDELASPPIIPESPDPQGPPDPQEPQASPDDSESSQGTVPQPGRRVTEDLQREIDEALGGFSIDDVLAGATKNPDVTSEPEIEKRYRTAVVKVHREDVFFRLPGHYEGVASLRQFDEPPEPGTMMEVIVQRFNAEDGIYEVAVPGASAEVQDWSDLSEGVVVEALITGHNSGGLECEINRIRGFIPISQVALYRVENLEDFVGQKMVCLVTEANPRRGNLVLSRRAILEREKAESREKLMGSLEAGQVLEGIVRKIMDFGAFVDLGGVDGLIHVSKLSWERVKHPSDVVEEGQKVKVKVESVDNEAGRIGLSLRDLVEHPWESASQKYVENSVVSGTVSKIAEFGAFVRLEAGIEGLVHISELAHHRVVRVSNVVNVGEEVAVKILSIDPDNQRMSLSMKAAMAAPAAETSTDKEEEDEPPRESAVKKKFEGELRGGTNRKSGGDQFGLNW